MFLLKEILFPKFCLGCGFLGNYICLRCRNKFWKLTNNRCFYCKELSFYGITHYRCRQPNGIDGFIYIYRYYGLLKKVIASTKYKLIPECIELLLKEGHLELFDKLIYYRKNYYPLLVQPIPLHVSRLKRRGFNQSEIIANFVCDQFSLPKIESLTKNKKTRAQAELKRNQRLTNLRNSFSVNGGSPIKGQNILLVDDVATSGSTLIEAAKALKANGASHVFAFALAKG